MAARRLRRRVSSRALSHARPLLTVAHRAQPIGADPAADQVVLHRVRAPIAERQVVFRRPDVAGVPFDFDPQRRVARRSAATASSSTRVASGRSE